MTSVRNMIPLLLTHDLRATIDFYTKTLNFEFVDGEPGDGDPFCQVRSDDASFMFLEDKTGAFGKRPGFSGYFYLYPHDLDAAWAELKDKTDVLMDLRTQPWGMREFRIRDPNGYVLTFGLADLHHGHGH